MRAVEATDRWQKEACDCRASMRLGLMKMWRRGGIVKGTKIMKVVPGNMKWTCVCDEAKQVHVKLAAFCWASAEINLSEYFWNAFHGMKGIRFHWRMPTFACYDLMGCNECWVRIFFKASRTHLATHKQWRHQKLVLLFQYRFQENA